MPLTPPKNPEPWREPCENWRSKCHNATVIGDLSYPWYEINHENHKTGGELLREGVCSECAELQYFTLR